MKIKLVLSMLISVAALIFNYSPVLAEHHVNIQEPAIALILSKPSDTERTKDEADTGIPAEGESTEMPVDYKVSDDSPAEKGNGQSGQVAEAEIPVQLSATDLFNLGVAHDKSGTYSEAIESYKRAIRIKPDYAEAYYNLAFSYMLSGDITSAHEEYMLLKEINPQMAEDLYSKALIMVRSNPENKYIVQVGAFRKIQNAENILDKLKANYMHARIEAEDGYSKVRLFGMKSKEEADVMMKDISDKYKVAPFLVPLQ
ncbi:MAG: tetratricopeptide repeat protein [Nitrospiraceae bacterium]|nr:MAG: tetratricopeptide repeat protein [Nitrospiraceae bacterium]